MVSPSISNKHNPIEQTLCVVCCVLCVVKPLGSATRRLVCYCRLYDVTPSGSSLGALGSAGGSAAAGAADEKRSEQLQVVDSCDARQREVFLFNDLLLVCSPFLSLHTRSSVFSLHYTHNHLSHIIIS